MTTTVILGAGIIGCSTAYYLSSSPSTQTDTIHLIETSPTLFASASGYAAGFLAADWFGPDTASLGELSFRLHKQLAEEHGGAKRWGYSRSTGTSMVDTKGKRGDEWLRDGGSRAALAGEHEFVDGAGPAWLTEQKGRKVEVISEDGSTAQLDPRKLCQFLLGESLERGVRLHHPARAVSVSKDETGVLSNIRIAGEDGSEYDIPCTCLIITAGAWTPRVFSQLFPASKLRIPISTLAGHSLVVKSPRWTQEHEANGCHAIFTTDPAGFSPEVFSRVGGEIYIAGLNDANMPLPKLATDAQPQKKEMQQLKNTAKQMLGLASGVDDLEVVREGLCFRPVTARGPPIISRILDAKLGDGLKTRGGGHGGVFIAAGHGPWGISQSLGTGKVLAEMVEGQPTTANVSRLSV